MTGARRLLEEGWSLSLQFWQEPVPFGIHRHIQEGREGLQYFQGPMPGSVPSGRVTKQLKVSWIWTKQAGGEAL